MPLFSLLAIAPHGPHSRHPEHVVIEYWDKVVEKALQVRRKGDRILVLTDANAHVHADSDAERRHASHFQKALARLGATNHILADPLPTYESSFHTFVQDDSIASCVGVKADTSTLEIPQFAHCAKGSFHQPITMQISFPPGSHEVSKSRRVLPYDNRNLGSRR